MGDNYKDLEELARSTTEDYYALLAVPFDAEEPAIKRAYRKASIRYHPDKNPDSKDAADRFIALGWARDILVDPKLKGEYDRARSRRREKALQDELLTGNRRKMKEELERRERENAHLGASLKRKRAADMTDAERREQEIQRLAEDGKRRRKEAQDRKDKARKDEDAAAADPVRTPEPHPPKPGDSPELDRTIKVRFHRDAETAAWDRDSIRSLFDKYGKIDSIIMAKDKKLKLDGEKHRKLVATVFIVYARLDHAHAAVLDAKQHHPVLDSVTWANGEPDLSTNTRYSSTNTPQSNTNTPQSNTDTPQSNTDTPQSNTDTRHSSTNTHSSTESSDIRHPNTDTTFSAKPSNTTHSNMNGTSSSSTHERHSTTNGTSSSLRPNHPSTPSTPTPLANKSFRASFGSSFPAGTASTPLGTPKFSFSPKTPSLEEVTMMRLKNAEKKRLEDQIRKKEASEVNKASVASEMSAAK